MTSGAPAAAAVPVYMIHFRPPAISAHSSMYPLAEQVHAQSIFFRETWKELERTSWTLAHGLRTWGCRHYGSEWNVLVPHWSDRTFLRRLPSETPHIAHFLWSEFAAPGRPERYRKRKARLVGTFHASARRQPQVLGKAPVEKQYDWITCVSKSQVPYFVERGVPVEQIRVILHGVDTRYFHPGEEGVTATDGPLCGLLVGKTERDHAFMAGVMKRMHGQSFQLQVLTVPSEQEHYRGVPGVTLLPRLDEAQLRETYRQADLLVMPMLDCTANNSVLEAMACGTPVFTHRVGGMPEYVDPASGFLLDGKHEDEWVDRLRELCRDRTRLRDLRPRVRAWAETFAWERIAPQYLDLYRHALGC